MIGEGGSGGALALAVANEVWMLENSTYSILSPEGFASILWKDSKRANEAADVMKITAQDLKELGMIEQIIPEVIDNTFDGSELPIIIDGDSEEEEVTLTSANMETIAATMKQGILQFIERYREKADRITEERYERFRGF